jgi:cytidine deaminase
MKTPQRHALAEITETDWKKLLLAAEEVRLRAHAPYSRYQVGAALLTKSGALFAGCNVENASYGLALCAERNALGHMIAAGEREPIAVVVVTLGPDAGSPCGMCRQSLAEFAGDELPIRLLVTGQPSSQREVRLGYLLPEAFRGDVLPSTNTL